MIIAALINYITYFKKFFKCLFIISLSIILFYLVFLFSIHLPVKNADVHLYNEFLDTMNVYLSSIAVSDIFKADFLSELSSDMLEILEIIEIDISFGALLIVISSVIVVGAFCLARYDCKRKIRSDVKNKDTAWVLTQNIAKVTFNAILWVIFFIVTYYWFFAIFILPILFLLFDAIKLLLYTWYVYFRKYELNQFLTIKNIITLFMASGLNLYLHSILLVFLSQFLSFYAIMLLALSFYAYSITVMEFTATKYFLNKGKTEVYV